MSLSVTTVWSSSTPQDIYICQYNLITSGPVKGVMSCGLIDLPYYDGDNYRDDFTGSVYGLETTGTTPSIESGQNVPVAYPVASPGLEKPDGTPKIINTDLIIHTDGAGATAPSTQAITSAYVSMSDSSMHVPPRNEQKKQTVRVFYSAANCTGNVLFDLPEDQFRGYSTAPFAFIA